jgi:hypothetical protein
MPMNQLPTLDVNNLITGARQLFKASDNKEFSDKYQAALQQEPEIRL